MNQAWGAAIAAALMPIVGILWEKGCFQLEKAAFLYLPDGWLKSFLIADWSSCKTPKTLEELKEQRERDQQ